jgi:hypothetical protein
MKSLLKLKQKKLFTTNFQWKETTIPRDKTLGTTRREEMEATTIAEEAEAANVAEEVEVVVATETAQVTEATARATVAIDKVAKTETTETAEATAEILGETTTRDLKRAKEAVAVVMASAADHPSRWLHCLLTQRRPKLKKSLSRLTSLSWFWERMLLKFISMRSP